MLQGAMGRDGVAPDANILDECGCNLKSERLCGPATQQAWHFRSSIALTILAQTVRGYKDPGVRSRGILAKAMEFATRHPAERRRTNMPAGRHASSSPHRERHQAAR